MALAGNTVTLTFVFVDGGGDPVNPAGAVTVRIYDASGRQVGEDATIPVEDALSTGTFEYPYLVPGARPQPQEAYFDYEASAEMPDGTVQTGRRREPIAWTRR